MKTTVIDLGCYGIVITIEGEAGRITDSLHLDIQFCQDAPDYAGKEETESMETYNNLIDGITSLILGHACAGIDVESPAYLKGIETAVDACAQYA